MLAPVGIWSVFALGLQVHRALLWCYLDFFEFNLVLDGRVDQSVGRCYLIDHSGLRLCELRVVARPASWAWKAARDIIILESADVVISLIHVTARCVFAQLQRAFSVPSLEAGAEIPKGGAEIVAAIHKDLYVWHSEPLLGTWQHRLRRSSKANVRNLLLLLRPLLLLCKLILPDMGPQTSETSVEHVVL